MEDVLDLYAEPYDEKRPTVGFDETSKQLIAETRAPLRAQAGRPERYDYEYSRQGVRNLFSLLRSAARLAARRGDRAADDARLRAADEVAGG
jgi:hypothetical protein